MSADASEIRPEPEPDASAPTGDGGASAGDDASAAPASKSSRTPEGPAVGGSAILKMALGFYGVVGLFAFGYALFSGGLSTLFGTRSPDLPSLAVGLALGVVLVLLSRVGASAWAPMRRMSETLADLLGPLSWQHAVGLAALSGIAEEMLFRGALWPHLGLVGTTLLFALVHVLPRRALWIYPFFALLVGLLFGLLREGTQSLWPCVLAHFTVNALNLAWIGGIARRRAADAG